MERVWAVQTAQVLVAAAFTPYTALGDFEMAPVTIGDLIVLVAICSGQRRVKYMLIALLGAAVHGYWWWKSRSIRVCMSDPLCFHKVEFAVSNGIVVSAYVAAGVRLCLGQ